MSNDNNWSDDLQINGWTGEDSPKSPLGKNAVVQLLKRPQAVPQMLFPSPIDLSDWRHEKVGWGLILPLKEGLSDAELATADDAPEPIRTLFEMRRSEGAARVYRYIGDATEGDLFLRDYSHGTTVPLADVSHGVAPGSLPFYNLIYATPDEIPWGFQYILNTKSAVGRLPLTGDGLENYVSALLKNWDDDSIQAVDSLIWAVQHSEQDITHKVLMAVAHQLHKKYLADESLKEHVRFFDGSQHKVTHSDLKNGLSAHRPALIITTSHGKTGPLNDLTTMGQDLGLPVDGDHAPLDLDTLLSTWRPAGAIWYAHACCSAGASGRSQFADLFDEESSLRNLLEGIAQLGPRISPLPTRLLGHKKPLRAFIGHVEPTFDWTIVHNRNNQLMTKNVVSTFYQQLYGFADENAKTFKPVGLAMQQMYKPIGTLLSQYLRLVDRFNDGEEVGRDMLATTLAAEDWASLVILGDPVVSLPSI